MEELIMKIISNLGVAGVGYAFLYLVLTKYFKQTGTIVIEVKNLCNDVKKLIVAFNNLKELQAKQQELDRALTDDIKESYIKISTKIEAQSTKIHDIYTICYELAKDKHKVPIGIIAVNKGYLTQKQLEECLKEQKELGD